MDRAQHKVERGMGNPECVELLIEVIEPRFQSVFNFTVVYPAVQLNHSCATQAALERDLTRVASTN